MVKGRALARPSERSERFEPVVMSQTQDLIVFQNSHLACCELNYFHVLPLPSDHPGPIAHKSLWHGQVPIGFYLRMTETIYFAFLLDMARFCNYWHEETLQVR